MDDGTYKQLLIVVEELMLKNGVSGDGPFSLAIEYLAPRLEAYEGQRHLESAEKKLG